MKKYKKINYVLFGLIVLFFVASPVFAANMDACNKYLSVTIDEKIAYACKIIVLIIQIVIPILLIIFGLVDFVKAITAQKEDEIKKGQQTFIKRAIAAIIVFFVVSIVKIAVGFGAGSDAKRNNILNCVACFTDGPDSKECQIAPADEKNNSQQDKESDDKSQEKTEQKSDDKKGSSN